MSEDIIDLKDVLERVQDDKELLLELLDIYEEDFVNKRTELESAVKAADATRIKEVAHAMKGAAGNISARPMHAVCLQIEQLAKVNDIAAVGNLLKDIDGYFARIKANKEKLKQEFAK